MQTPAGVNVGPRRPALIQGTHMRREFSKRTKLVCWNRAGGQCEKCTAKLFHGNVEYHHIKECAFDGGDTPENCQVLCRTCHRKITGQRAAVIAKSNRQHAKNAGIRKPRTIRAWRKFDGRPVFATRER